MVQPTFVGKTFLKLLERHFPKQHPMHRIFSRNTVKISYCCMRIWNHGICYIVTQKANFESQQRIFWMHLQSSDNKCLTPNVGYEGKVSNKTNNECKRYLGASETQFKERFRNNTRDFQQKKYQKCTELSKYIWTLKSHGIKPIVTWSIVKRPNSKTAANYCKLCLIEKFYIIQSLDDKDLW